MARLIVISSDERRAFELSASDSIGRRPENSIQILDRIASTKHAEVRRLPDGTYLLKDLQSLNGTFVGGERIHEHRLEDGDEIRMGSTRLLFVSSSPEGEAKGRVTMATELAKTRIRHRIAAPTGEFLHEQNIGDDRVVRRDYERLRIGHELAMAIGSEFDLEKLLPKILDKAFELVNADRGAILLMDDENELTPRHVRFREGKGEDTIAISETVIAEVLRSRAAVLSSDAGVDSRFSGARSVILQGIRSTMTIPLLHRDELVGILHLDSQIAGNAFTEKDLQICTGMAAQAAIAIQNAGLAARIARETRTRAQISRLVPPSVVEQVLSGELDIERGGRLSEITMLYSDIRGFTAMSDGRPPEDVVNTLNEYFEVMVEVLFRHGGTLDKFVGDAIIGLFGAPIELDDAASKAVACSVDMMRSLDEFNRTRRSENLPAIEIGIGINTGHVVTGMVGSSKSLQYTAIGDAMNVASRLVSKAEAGQILISDFTFHRLGRGFETVALPPVLVKGKSDPLEIHQVLGRS